MNITYKNPGFNHSIDSISLFLTGDETSFWSAPIFHFYPQLDKHTLVSLNSADKHKYLNDVFYMSSEKGALGLSLHEVIHYFWFYVWNGHFGDSYDEYETPSLKWILSEMVIETIMSDERLSSLNPYFPKENGGCIYPYFQNMIINGSPILDTINTLYHRNSITDFMEEAYAYCLKYEKEIRKHIEIEENAF